MNNFQGMMIIYSALNLGSVEMLKATWKEISKQHSGILKSIQTLMDPNNNFKNYRSALKEVSLPVLPFQGTYLNDFTIIDEVPSKLSNGMINFDKMRTLSNMFQQIQKFQSNSFCFIRIPYIEEFFKRSVVLDEKELYTAAEKVKNQIGVNPSEFLSFHRPHTAPKVKNRKRYTTLKRTLRTKNSASSFDDPSLHSEEEKKKNTF